MKENRNLNKKIEVFLDIISNTKECPNGLNIEECTDNCLQCWKTFVKKEIDKDEDS